MMMKVMIWMISGLFFAVAATAVCAKDNAQKVAVIYGSRYGSTAQTAKWIAEGIGKNAQAISAKEAKDLKAYQSIVLGTGIYGGKPQEDLAVLLAQSKEAIKDKVIAVFVVCGAPSPEDQQYLNQLIALSGAQPTVLSKGFRGWQKKELLSTGDRSVLEKYYQRIGKPFENYDHTDRAQSIAFGQEINSTLAKNQASKGK